MMRLNQNSDYTPVFLHMENFLQIKLFHCEDHVSRLFLPLTEIDWSVILVLMTTGWQCKVQDVSNFDVYGDKEGEEF